MMIDASVAFKWLVHEPDSDVAIQWISSGEEMNAPSLVIAETGNALTKRIRRGELDEEGAAERFAGLNALLNLIDETPFMGRAFELSLQLRHSIYDCIYLAAAEARDEQLLTADRVFVAKLTGHDLSDRLMLLGVVP